MYCYFSLYCMFPFYYLGNISKYGLCCILFQFYRNCERNCFPGLNIRQLSFDFSGCRIISYITIYKSTFIDGAIQLHSFRKDIRKLPSTCSSASTVFDCYGIYLFSIYNRFRRGSFGNLHFFFVFFLVYRISLSRLVTVNGNLIGNLLVLILSYLHHYVTGNRFIRSYIFKGSGCLVSGNLCCCVFTGISVLTPDYLAWLILAPT